MAEDKWKNLTGEAKEAVMKFSNYEPKEIAKKYDDVSVATIKQYIKDQKENPQFNAQDDQEAEFKIGGYDPSVFTNSAKQITYSDAFTEIIDGIFENHSRNKDDGETTEVLFELSNGGNMLVITETSGGIRKNSLNSVAKLGDSGWGSLYGVGIFGLGLKKGLRKIAKHHELFTWHPDDAHPRQVKFDQDYWADAGKSQAEVFPYLGENVPKGTTVIRFTDLEKYTEPLEFNDKLMKKLGMAYHSWENDLKGKISISFKEGDQEEVKLVMIPTYDEEVWKNIFSFVPEFEPRVFEWNGIEGTPLEGEETKVDIRVVFGIRKDGSPKESGVHVYGNGRMFFGPGFIDSNGVGQEAWWGFGQPTNYDKIKPYSSENYKFDAYVYIKAGNPADIPWNTSHKNGYDHLNSWLHAKCILKMIQCAAKPYMDFIQVTKNPQTEWFGVNPPDITNQDFLDDLVPVSQNKLETPNAKKTLETAKKWKPRLLFNEPIDFNIIKVKGSKSKHWDPEGMDLVHQAVLKKKKSDDKKLGDIEDFYYIRFIFDYFSRTASNKKVEEAAEKKAAEAAKAAEEAEAKAAEEAEAKKKEQAAIAAAKAAEEEAIAAAKAAKEAAAKVAKEAEAKKKEQAANAAAKDAKEAEAKKKKAEAAKEAATKKAAAHKTAKTKNSSKKKAKSIGSTQLSKEKKSYGGHLLPASLQSFRKQSASVGLPHKPERLEIEQLMSHFLATREFYDREGLPKDDGWDKWMKEQLWKDPKGKYSKLQIITNIEGFNVQKLKKICKHLGISDYSKMKKADLVKAIKGKMEQIGLS